MLNKRYFQYDESGGPTCHKLNFTKFDNAAANDHIF